MYTIVGGDQQQYGPVSVDEVRRWIAEGRASAQTQALAEGATEWKPLSAFPEFSEALRAQGGQPSATSGIAPLADSAAWRVGILARQPELQVGRCLLLSWRLLSGNLGLFFGAAFLIWLIGTLCQFIPFAGILYSVLWGVLYGGLYLIFLNRIRGQTASISDVFAGFRLEFVQLLLAGFVSALLSCLGLFCCLILPGLYLVVAWTFSVPLVADKHLEFWSAMELSRKVVTRVWFETFGLVVVAFLPFILTYAFAQIMILFTGFSAIRDAMASGPPDFGRMMQVATQITKSSLPLVLLIKFVLLLNLPFALGALMYAYESLFGTRTAPNA
jgi:hypothetical protein